MYLLILYLTFFLVHIVMSELIVMDKMTLWLPISVVHVSFNKLIEQE